MSKITYARAPVRLDCGGGGTDCPPYSTDHGGAVVNVGLSLHAHARVERRDDRVVRIESEDFAAVVEVAEIADLELTGELDLLVGIVRRLQPNFGLTLSVRSDVPPGSGLGSSGAVGVACVAALDAAMGVHRVPEETARLANDIERRDLGYAGGDQDSFGPAFGGWNHLIYRPGEATEVRRLAVPEAMTWEIERRAVLVYVGEPHLSGNIHEDIRVSYADPESATRKAMEGLHVVGQEIAKTLEDGDLRGFANCLKQNWQHHQGLHPSCASPGLLAAYEAADGLVVGGKTCGAGGGGCVFFLAAEGQRRVLEERLLRLGGHLLPMRVDPRGVVTWS